MTAVRHAEDRLQPALLPYVDNRPQVHVQQDNARLHIARRTCKLS